MVDAARHLLEYFNFLFLFVWLGGLGLMVVENLAKQAERP